jgi:hypothetical protein
VKFKNRGFPLREKYKTGGEKHNAPPILCFPKNCSGLSAHRHLVQTHVPAVAHPIITKRRLFLHSSRISFAGQNTEFIDPGSIVFFHLCIGQGQMHGPAPLNHPAENIRGSDVPRPADSDISGTGKLCSYAYRVCLSGSDQDNTIITYNLTTMYTMYMLRTYYKGGNDEHSYRTHTGRNCLQAQRTC